MATFILKWNPAISSYKMIDYLRELDMLLSGGDVDMDWSIWDHDKIKKGDTVYMLKVGHGATGIIMKGTVTTPAWQGGDWSGRGRVTYYANFDPTCMISPDCAPILDSASLSSAMPDFDWRGGHSGLMVSAEYEQCLNSMWDDLIHANFGPDPVSKYPSLYVKPEGNNHPRLHPADQHRIDLGYSLLHFINEQRRHPIGTEYNPVADKAVEVARWLIKDDDASPMLAYANLECANNTPWESYDYLTYLSNAVNAFKALADKGVKVDVDIKQLEDTLKDRQEFDDYLSDIEDKAEEGELSEDLRDLIDGFDTINRKMGSFHDSELHSVDIHHEEDYIDLEFYMCNGADHILKIRFEGSVDYNIKGEADIDSGYLFWGYFYARNNRIYLKLEDIGTISADQARVISFEAAPDDDE